MKTMSSGPKCKDVCISVEWEVHRTASSTTLEVEGSSSVAAAVKVTGAAGEQDAADDSVAGTRTSTSGDEDVARACSS